MAPCAKRGCSRGWASTQQRSERYPRQLHELELAEYLEIKKPALVLGATDPNSR